jgi:hypothetical protein
LIAATLQPALFTSALVNNNIWQVLEIIQKRAPDHLRSALVLHNHDLIAVLLASTGSFAVLLHHRLKRFM